MTDLKRENIPILLKGNGVLLCQKPVGILSQGGTESDPSLPQLLRGEFGGALPAVITRLDRGVGGVCVLASPKAAASMTALVQDHEKFVKEYLAIAELREGAPEAEGRMVDLLYHDAVRNKTFPVKKMRRGVKEAVLTYRLLAEREGLGLFSVRLYTGRTHQIRAQFASRRMPLYGDGKYGSVRKGAIALFAHRVSFPAPNGGGGIEGVATPPTETAPWGLFSDLL